MLFLVCSLQFSTATLAQMPALAPLPGTGSLSQPANPAQFTFVLAGDNRPAHSGDPQSAVPGNIFCAVQRMNPPAAFVLWTGDTISGKDPQHPKRMHDQYKEFLGIATRAGVPVFNAPGNHEMDDSKETPSKTMKDLYRKYMAGTYGAFSYGNTRFIALDSENEPSNATKTLTTAEGQAKIRPREPSRKPSSSCSRKTLTRIRTWLISSSLCIIPWSPTMEKTAWTRPA
jgi:hypothetical protein